MEFELPIDFKELLQTFNYHGVEYLLTGGYAVGMHGYARATNDIDIVVAPDQANAEKVYAALVEFGLAGPDLKIELFTTPRSLVVVGGEPFAVDIMNYLEGVDFQDAYERREIRRVEDIEINLVSLNDLLTNKTLVSRDKDLLDVKELRRINDKK